MLFPVVSLEFVLSSDKQHHSYSHFQMCKCCNSVPLEFEWHGAHLAKQTKQNKGPRVQMNHSRHASVQPEGNFSESLNANALHYSWRNSALLPNQTAALNLEKRLGSFACSDKKYWDSFLMSCRQTVVFD